VNKAAAVALAFVALVPTAGMTLAAGLVSAAASTDPGAVPCGPAGPARDVAGTPLDAEQLANAATITAVTAGRRLPSAAAVVAVATALQESSLRNLPGGDRDSLGLFQQRAGWGPASVRLDPVGSTGLFLDALDRVPAWDQLPVVVASDRVQHSAYPWAVSRWEAAATALVGASWPAPTSPNPVGGGGTGVSRPAAVPAAGAGCPGAGSDGMSLPGVDTVPAGYAPPTGAGQGAVARFALAQLGKPYVWGATGPDAWDCSGLTMAAWAAAGVALPRTTFAQVLAGSPVPSAAGMQPGDLIFIAGLDGTPASPGHVGLFLGDIGGTPSLIHAPRTGKTVEIQPISAWRGQIVAIRRPTTAAAAPTTTG